MSFSDGGGRWRCVVEQSSYGGIGGIGSGCVKRSPRVAMVDDDSSQGIRIGSRWPQTEGLTSEAPEGE